MDHPDSNLLTLRRTLNGALLLTIAYLGFVSLGLPDTIAGIAWPSVRDQFTRSQNDFGLIFIALGIGYCASSFFGGKLSAALGVGALLAASSGLVAVAMFGSALASWWPVFVACGVIWGLGSGAIDAGINAYVSHHFSARHVNWLHACYSLGATLGPLLMTAMVVHAGSWRFGYALVGAILLAMTLTFLVTLRRWHDPAQAAADQPAAVRMGAVLAEPLVWLQIIVFFLYTGLEFTVGQWCFTLLTEARAASPELAGMLVGAYFGAIGVGRVVFGAVADRIGLDRLIRFATLGAAAGAVAFAFAAPTPVRQLGLVVIGLGLAPVFPCMMARTPQRLGVGYAAHAVGFQVSAAMLGAALVPGLAGLLAEGIGLESVAQFAVLLAILLWATHEVLLQRSRKRLQPSDEANAGVSS